MLRHGRAKTNNDEHVQQPGDAAISPTKTSLSTVTKKMTLRRMRADFRLHEAPHVGGSGENDPKRGSSQLSGVVASVISVRMYVASPNPLLFGGHRGIT